MFAAAFYRPLARGSTARSPRCCRSSTAATTSPPTNRWKAGGTSCDRPAPSWWGEGWLRAKKKRLGLMFRKMEGCWNVDDLFMCPKLLENEKSWMVWCELLLFEVMLLGMWDGEYFQVRFDIAELKTPQLGWGQNSRLGHDDPHQMPGRVVPHPSAVISAKRPNMVSYTSGPATNIVVSTVAATLSQQVALAEQMWFLRQRLAPACHQRILPPGGLAQTTTVWPCPLHTQQFCLVAWLSRHSRSPRWTSSTCQRGPAECRSTANPWSSCSNQHQSTQKICPMPSAQMLEDQIGQPLARSKPWSCWPRLRSSLWKDDRSDAVFI